MMTCGAAWVTLGEGVLVGSVGATDASFVFSQGVSFIHSIIQLFAATIQHGR